MKIALISARRDPFISPYDMDGGCVVLRNYIKELQRAGHEIVVFTRLEKISDLNDKKTNLKAKLQKKHGIGRVEIKNGVTIYRVNYKSSFCKIKNEDSLFSESKTFIDSIEKYLKSGNFDIIHYFHLMSIGGWLIGGRKIFNLKKTVFTPLLITKGRTFQFPTEKRLKLEKRVFNMVNYIACQSEGEIRQIKKYYKLNQNKLIKIPLGIDKDIFYPKNFIDDKSKRLIIISPNSIKAQKRQTDLIKITKDLKDQKINVLTIIVGNESEQSYANLLRSNIVNNKMSYIKLKYFNKIVFDNIKDDFIFLKPQKEKELAKIIRYSDISIFTSKDEGFCLSLIDCMACGTLPFCYNLSAYKDYLIQKENAIAISKNLDYKYFVKAIIKFYKNRKKLIRISKTAVNTSNYFSWSNLIKKQIYVYRKIAFGGKMKYIKYNAMKNWINLNDCNQDEL